MELLVRAAGVGISMALLASLSCYTWLIHSGKSHVIYRSEFERPPARYLWLLGLAGAAFCVCVFSGTRSMLWFLPSTWAYGEDGYFAVGGLAVAAIGVPLAAAIHKLALIRFDWELQREQAAVLRRMFAASDDWRSLAGLRVELEKRTSALRQSRAKGGQVDVLERERTFEFRRESMLLDLVRLIDEREQRLSQGQLA